MLFCPFELLSTEIKTNACLSCHPYPASDFSPLHGFAYASCAICHAGEEQATELPQAHAGLIARPGDLNKDRSICANCHPRQTGNVLNSLMNTGKGLVKKTRQALGEQAHPQIHAGLESLGDSPADSMLRKLCASCHLAHAAAKPAADVTLARGGGCSACHINQRAQGRHPRLSAKVEDGRCFGCHSRSGRISLNYVGLAEAEADSRQDPAGLMQLPDGRTVAKLTNDIHHQAGMSCIDCHTSTGIMGGADNSGFKQQAVDISCSDCHSAATKRTDRNNWPEAYAQMQRYLDQSADRMVPLTQRHGTPLWHIEIQPDGSRLLHPKLGGAALPIPDYKGDAPPHAGEHARLACSACHSQWAPQCYGCHSEYDPAGRQWDHLKQRETAGRWRETRWDVRAELPALGVDGHNLIRPVTPGMIMRIEHPDLDGPLFRRLFAISEPHTTGPARSCDSCHRSSQALSLGNGRLHKTNGKWTFQPAKKNLADGLPADAWTSLDGKLQGAATDGESRPFNQDEMVRILNADISR
ncbi:MAG: hypothetical protein ABFR65_00020 [Pseudomonadota bacterium]